MDLFRSFLQTMFFPSAVDFNAGPTSQESSEKQKIGYFIGMLGFMVQGIFIFPSDEIRFKTEYDAVLNGIVGLILGVVLFGFLIGFERLISRWLKIENAKNALAVSYAIFGLMPLLTIPVHMIFFDELSARGYFWIAAVMIVLILAWHFSIFASVLAAKENGFLNKIIIIFAIEIVLAFVFLFVVPIATGNSTKIFLEEYF
jgi:hypothetical protein